jgi:hypothetical protein
MLIYVAAGAAVAVLGTAAAVSVNLPEFRADCKYSHRKADDPIVAPGLPGASHMHSFVGNKAVDASTAARSGTTRKASCRCPTACA